MKVLITVSFFFLVNSIFASNCEDIFAQAAKDYEVSVNQAIESFKEANLDLNESFTKKIEMLQTNNLTCLETARAVFDEQSRTAQTTRALNELSLRKSRQEKACFDQLQVNIDNETKSYQERMSGLKNAYYQETQRARATYEGMVSSCK